MKHRSRARRAGRGTSPQTCDEGRRASRVGRELRPPKPDRPALTTRPARRDSAGQLSRKGQQRRPQRSSRGGAEGKGDLARARARRRMKDAASSLHPPPTARATGLKPEIRRRHGCWNTAGYVPRGPWSSLNAGLVLLAPELGVCPTQNKGLRFLGSSFGSDEFVRTQSRASHDQLLHLPELLLVVAAFVLLSPLQPPPPDAGLARHGRVRRRPRLGCSVHFRGLSRCGLSSRPGAKDRPVALVTRWPWLAVCCSAYWASWAGCLPVLRQHLPRAAQAFLRDLEAPGCALPLRCCHTLRRAPPCRLEPPPLAHWRELCDGAGGRLHLCSRSFAPCTPSRPCNMDWRLIVSKAPLPSTNTMVASGLSFKAATRK